MDTPLSPIVSEFETQEQAEQHDRWVRQRVRESLTEPRPPIAHDEVMGEMRELIEAKRRESGAG